MAINPSPPYRLGFYYRDRNEYFIQQNPLSREQAIQEVKDHYDPDAPDTDVFVAFSFGPDDYARDAEATEIAQHVSDSEGSDDESVASNSEENPPAMPPMPETPAAQAAIFFPVKEDETESQRQERIDAQTLFATYPRTAKDLWRRFHEPDVVESTMFDIWETGRHATQGPKAAKDMVIANIARMKGGKAWELQAMEDLYGDDD